MQNQPGWPKFKNSITGHVFYAPLLLACKRFQDEKKRLWESEIFLPDALKYLFLLFVTAEIVFLLCCCFSASHTQPIMTTYSQSDLAIW